MFTYLRIFVSPTAAQQIPAGSTAIIQDYIILDEAGERDFLNHREPTQNLMFTLVNIISRISSDSELAFWSLCLLNGMIEDLRTRVKELAEVSRKRGIDVVQTLYSYILQQSTSYGKTNEIDLASHVLAVLIEARGPSSLDHARNFLIHLLDNSDNANAISKTAYTHCLMYLLKTNELALIFC